MARKKTQPQPEPIEPEEESQEVPDEEPAAVLELEPEDEPETSGNGPNKSQAARAAIDAGYEKPGSAVEYIKKTFGIDMNPQHFSAIKSNYKKKQGGGAPAEVEVPASKLRAADAPAPKTSTTGDSGLLTDLAAVKHLVERLGAVQVRQIVDLFE